LRLIFCLAAEGDMVVEGGIVLVWREEGYSKSVELKETGRI
jgi:hypothetical protein